MREEIDPEDRIRAKSRQIGNVMTLRWRSECAYNTLNALGALAGMAGGICGSVVAGEAIVNNIDDRAGAITLAVVVGLVLSCASAFIGSLIGRGLAYCGIFSSILCCYRSEEEGEKMNSLSNYDTFAKF